MHRTVLAAFLAAMFILAACGSPTPSPSLAPSVDPSPPPSVEPSAPSSPAPSTPVVSPVPSAPADPGPSAEEQTLIDGILRGAIDCVPVRDDLPTGAIAGIECASDDAQVARIGFYRFADDETMLDAYIERMTAEGVALDSGSCRDGEHEGAYVPGEGLIADRNGCFTNDQGYANYRVTIAGFHLYIGILGRSQDMVALEDFAWEGNQDTPGGPTLWVEPS